MRPDVSSSRRPRHSLDNDEAWHVNDALQEMLSVVEVDELRTYAIPLSGRTACRMLYLDLRYIRCKGHRSKSQTVAGGPCAITETRRISAASWSPRTTRAQ